MDASDFWKSNHMHLGLTETPCTSYVGVKPFVWCSQMFSFCHTRHRVSLDPSFAQKLIKGGRKALLMKHEIVSSADVWTRQFLHGHDTPSRNTETGDGER